MMTRAGIGLLLVAALAVPLAGAASAQDFDQTSCDEFLLKPREVRGQRVGPSACMMQETDVLFDGRTFRRLDMGINGTVDGFVTRSGDYQGVLTNAPDLVFPQTENAGPAVPALAAYQRTRGASMTVLYPLERARWNGKIWVTAHGEGLSFANRKLRSWEDNLDRTKPLHDLDAYDRLILSKGYALVKTRRTSAAAPGEVVATLGDGGKTDVALTDAAQYVADFARLAANVIGSRLGTPPSRTYLYGHSAGASLGRAINYAPGLNVASGERPLFHAILADSAAGGVWLPLNVKSGSPLVPQMDVVHQLYNTPWRAGAESVSLSPLVNARANAVSLRELGFNERSRTYEVRGATHEPAEGTAESEGHRGLDLSPVMDRLIDHLDAWADRGIAPPETRSDSEALGKMPGIALPPAACPLGVYYPFPHGASGGSAFAPFGSDDELEPLDERGVFVDMNLNAIRDRRETPAQAWRRIGLLRAGEELTRAKYVACVEAAVRGLQEAGFLSERAARSYIEQAGAAPLTRGSQAP